jgi:subtilisin family serine protease
MNARFVRCRAPRLGLAAALALGLLGAEPAAAFDDGNSNRIDDAIDRVHAMGWAAAFENDDPTRPMTIGVFDETPLRYAVYVGYDHRPTPADEAALAALGMATIKRYLYIDYIRTAAPYAQLERMARLPGVTRIEAIPIMYPINHIATRTTRVQDSRGFRILEDGTYFPSARADLGLSGEGVVVAILDTGVNDAPFGSYPGHAAFAGKFLGGGEFFSGDPALSTPLDESMNPQDNGEEVSSNHGTHVAGTTLGAGGPGDYFSGVAPAARLVDCKVLSDAGAGFGSADAIEWCIHNKDRLWEGLPPGSPYQGIDVLNLSLGCLNCSAASLNGTDANAQAVNAAVNAGLAVVVALGNDGQTNRVTSPASADHSISVAASDLRKTIRRDDDFITRYSNEGPRASDGDLDRTDEMKPSVAAPGGGDSLGAGILSANGSLLTDGTAVRELAGTSMASPHVAGIVALLRQANPALAPLQIRRILQNTAIHRRTGAKTASTDTAYTSEDPNYHAGWGWGAPDAYAAALEALDSTVTQVVLLRATAEPAQERIRVHWETQREFAHSGFAVQRAPDLGGAPGAFVTVSPAPVPGGLHPEIDKVVNRHGYDFDDIDPELTQGQRYWYRVECLDGSGRGPTPAYPVDYGQRPIVATAYYDFTHNTSDNDLMVTLGVDRGHDPALDYGRRPDFVTQGLLIPNQDRDSLEAGNATTGTIRHWFHVDFTVDHGVQGFVPPGNLNPWFFSALEGGFINRSGRLNDFSLFVPNSPGSSSGTTYVTNSVKPQQTAEGARTTLWIPEPSLVGIAEARLSAEGTLEGVRLLLELVGEAQGAEATVLRAESRDLERSAPLAGPQRLYGGRFEYLDASAEPLATYHYWVEIREADGRAILSGPVTATSGLIARTQAAAPRPNPARSTALLEYAIGQDVAAQGPVEVAVRIHDLQGRVVRDLERVRRGMGRYVVTWDTRDRNGRPVAPGLYYVRYRAGAVQETRRLAVLR